METINQTTKAVETQTELSDDRSTTQNPPLIGTFSGLVVWKIYQALSSGVKNVATKVADTASYLFGRNS